MNQTVVITRPCVSFGRRGSYQGVDRLQEKVTQAGFRCLYLPVLSITRLPVTPSISLAFEQLSAGEYSWLVLLSPSSVYACLDALLEVTGIDLLPGTTKVALQGTGTEEAFRQCFARRADLVPQVFLAEELARSLIRTLQSSGQLPSVKILLPQAKDGRDVVGPALSLAGISVDCFPLYSTEETPLSPQIKESFSSIPEGEVIFVFMSPSAVRATTKYIERRHKAASTVLCVGPITANEAKECGYERVFESKDHSEKGILTLLHATFGAP